MSGGGGGGGGTWDERDGGIEVDAPPQLIDARAIDAPCGDDDNDDICNGVDDWPCGAKPTTAPTGNATDTRNSGSSALTVTGTNLDQTTTLAVATSGENVTLAFNFSITDTACAQQCIDQIEIGWSPGNRVKCVFDMAVSATNGASGPINTTITAPTTTTPQVYDLRINLGQNFSCNYMGAMGWYTPAPGTPQTIAKLCVH